MKRIQGQPFDPRDPAITESMPHQRQCMNTNCGTSFDARFSKSGDFCCAACQEEARGLHQKARLKGEK